MIHLSKLRGIAAGFCSRVACAALLVAIGLTVISNAGFAQTAATRQEFDIPAGDAATALKRFTAQVKEQVLFSSEAVRGIKTQEVKGSFTAREALERLVAQTGLAADYDEKTGTFAIRRETTAEAKNVNRASADSSVRPSDAKAGDVYTDEKGDKVYKMPEYLVTGSKTLNADIRRTRDDIQPYVVFDRDAVQQSQATNLEEFFRSRLPMNAMQGTLSQQPGNGSRSQIDLRGLGANQTLILVDGRRMPATNDGGAFTYQSDVNGIPLNAIERIEILPAAASGIYGGSALGGVINIITRKDYGGVDLTASYGGSTRGDSENYRTELSAGFNLEDGRTHVRLALSRSVNDGLLVGDRDFAARGRALQFANNPNAFYALTTPPQGSTANIRSSNGSDLILKNGTALNSPRTYVPAGYGGIADGGAALVANAGKYNLDLPEDFFGNRRSLLNSTVVRSISATVRREFGKNVEVFLDYFLTQNRASGSNQGGAPASVTIPVNTSNPFTAPIVVSTSYNGVVLPLENQSDTQRAIGGVVWRLPREWIVSADASWGRSRILNQTTSPGLGDPDGASGPGLTLVTAQQTGALDMFRDQRTTPLDFTPYRLPAFHSVSAVEDIFEDANLRVVGPLWELPAGSLMLTSLAEWKRDRSPDQYSRALNTSAVQSFTWRGETSQSITSFYAEVRAPVFSPKKNLSFARSLELQASVRRDDFVMRVSNPITASVPAIDGPPPAHTGNTNKVGATKSTVGLSYSPVDQLKLRASYGTGFMAPTLARLVPGVPFLRSGVTAVDPKRGGISATLPAYTEASGGNPNLVPEESKSWSAGMVYTPGFLPRFRVSIDYTRIEKTNEISEILPVQTLFDFEAFLPGRVTRDPLTAADQALGYTGGVVTRLDRTNTNLSATTVEAYDIQADYDLPTDKLGHWHFYTVASYEPIFARQVAPSARFINNAGFTSGVLKWRGNGGITWEGGSWVAGWNLQYFDSYRSYTASATSGDIADTLLNQGSGTIPSQVYHDIFVTYRVPPATRSALWRGIELTVGVQNVFDRQPTPLASTTAQSAQSGYSLYADPRLQRYTLTLKKHF